MRAVDFPERNMMLAENQPQYETVPVFCELKEVEDDTKHVAKGGELVLTTKQVPWSMTACFELSDEEIKEIVATKRLWHTQMLFGNNFQPIRMSTQNPFLDQKVG